MDDLELQAEFKRLTEDFEQPIMITGTLWDDSPGSSDVGRKVFDFFDFMWLVYEQHGLPKLWDLYNSVYGEELRPFLSKMISDFVRRRGGLQ